MRRRATLFRLSVGDANSTSNYRPQITVYNPNGNQVGSSALTGFADSLRGRDLYRAGRRFSGTYTVIIQSEGGSTLGTYDLDLVLTPATQAPDSDGDGGPITSGQTKAGTINHFGDLDVYTFSASAGNTFKLSVGDTDATSNYRPQITVYDPNGNQVGTAATGFSRHLGGGHLHSARDRCRHLHGRGAGRWRNSHAGTSLRSRISRSLRGAQAPDPDGDGGPIVSGENRKFGQIDHYGDLDIYTSSHRNRRQHRQTGRRGCGFQHQLPPAGDGLWPDRRAGRNRRQWFYQYVGHRHLSRPRRWHRHLHRRGAKRWGLASLGNYNLQMIQAATTGPITPEGTLTLNLPIQGSINTAGGQDSWT